MYVTVFILSRFYAILNLKSVWQHSKDFTLCFQVNTRMERLEGVVARLLEDVNINLYYLL
jgi:hypothetical protein